MSGAGWETGALLEGMASATNFYFDGVSQVEMPAWTRGRVALVGDAAASPSLLAGQGSALAMVGAYVLASALATPEHDHPQAYANYQTQLVATMKSKQAAARRLRLVFAPRNRAELLLRNTAMRLMRLPGVTKVAVSRELRDGIELPAFPRT